jgi:hypothetical protein
MALTHSMQRMIGPRSSELAVLPIFCPTLSFTHRSTCPHAVHERSDGVTRRSNVGFFRAFIEAAA